MGLVRTSFMFDGRAPDAACIAERITAITGLAVTVADSSGTVMADLRQLHAKLSFTCAPQEEVTIYAYIPGAVRKCVEEGRTAGCIQYGSPIRTEGLDEPEGTQAAYLGGYVMQEGTLLAVAALALEALGGRPKEPIPDEERRLYGHPVPEAELLERHRRWRRKSRVIVATSVACHVIILPFLFVGTLVATPFLVWRASRAMRRNDAE